MPTPRPASSVTVSAVEKPGVKIRLASSASLVSAPAVDQAHRDAPLARMRARSRPAPSSRNSTADLVAFVRAARRRSCRSASLPAASRTLGQLDAVRHAVAQQVLEGAGHAVEHAAVDFDRAADDVQPHLLAGFLGGLAHDAVEAVRHALELDHARAQQVVLQVARQARLGDQLVFGRLQRALQGALHGGHVVDRLGHHARQFLEAREAVELERVEACDAALAASRRELICASACSSMSRSWPRRRSRLLGQVAERALIWPTPDSMRERVMLTSPAWLTRRSSSGARTRTADCVASGRSAGLTAPRALGAAKRDQSIDVGAAADRRGGAARSAAPRSTAALGGARALRDLRRLGAGVGAAAAAAAPGVATTPARAATGARSGSVGRRGAARSAPSPRRRRRHRPARRGCAAPRRRAPSHRTRPAAPRRRRRRRGRRRRQALDPRSPAGAPSRPGASRRRAARRP